MTIEIPPKGTRGAEMPRLGRAMMKATQGLMVWFARRSGTRLVVLTTVGARTGRPHTIAVGRFSDEGSAFLVIASNAGSARHPAWFINMAKNPDKVWAEVGKRKVRVSPQMLTGAERQAAMQRVIAASPGYASYEQKTDRQIPVIRLVPDE